MIERKLFTGRKAVSVSFKCAVIAVLVCLFFAGGLLAAEEKPAWPYEDESKQQRDERMAWWRDARFGMFIHWGVYAVPAGTYDGKQIPGIGEWIMNHGKIPVDKYKAYAKDFNPVKYDPDTWVKLAKDAGMKYIVITSKHHDGFALFDSKVTDWDVVDATPYGKDLIKPLAKACKKYGIKFGLYYSQAQDWCHPGGAEPDWSGGSWDPAQKGDMDKYLREIAVPQVKEILSNYGEISVIWWDTPFDMTKERAAMFEPVLKNYPGLITNNRMGGGYSGDTETPEQHIPATGFKDRDWETCMTMNGTWGYKSYDDNWKSTRTLLRNLVDIASKGGNYLLNVGPTAEGLIPQESIERLQEVGKWMKANGDSIYGTSASPFMSLEWGRCTKKVTGNKATLYLHVFQWPKDGKLIVPGLKNKPKKVYLLANGQKLKSKVAEGELVVSIPDEALDEIDTVIAVEIKGELKIDRVLPKQDGDGNVMLLPFSAMIHNVFGSSAQVEEIDKVMNIGFWTNGNINVDWKFKVTRPGKFKVVADLAIAESKTEFEVKLAGKTLACEAKSTGGYNSFKMMELGEVALDAAGEYTLVIDPKDQAWKPMNLRSVKLELIK